LYEASKKPSGVIATHSPSAEAISVKMSAPLLRRPYGQKIETAQRRQRSNIFGLGPVLHNKLAVDA
jgi:hypothetical protein